MKAQGMVAWGIAVAGGLLMSSSAFGADVPGKPTYTRDVAPILFKNCVTCHRPGDIGPMSLMTYDEVRPWAKSISKAVDNRVMPPWHADPEHGTFKNDRSLTDTEVETIVKWAKKGAKKGVDSDMPVAPVFGEDGWRLGEPDLVVQFKQIDLAGGGPDQFFDLVAKTDLTEDKWITAIEILPSNRKVAHHVIVWQGQDDGGQGWIGAWAAGTDPMVFPEKSGRLLKAGANIVGDMHYHPAETPESDSTRVGLHFAEDSEIEKELVNLWVQNASFEIPAGAENHPARATYTFAQDSHITALLPHLHYRGKDFKYTARFPDGTKQTLLEVNDYDFNWQTTYTLEEPLAVPKGTRIDCVAHWDNSTNNPDNPDPTKSVRFGNESYDEMMIGFIDYVVDEGVSPLTGKEVSAQFGVELSAKYPGDVYEANVIQGDGQSFFGVLVMPKNVATGTWHLTIMGSKFEAPVSDIAWNGSDFKASVDLMGQIYKFKGTITEDGTLVGNLIDPDDPENEEAVILKGRKL